MSLKASSLSVKGARYNQRNGDETRDRLPERLSPVGVNGHFNNFFLAQQGSSHRSSHNTMGGGGVSSAIAGGVSTAVAPTQGKSQNGNHSPPTIVESKSYTVQKYWKMGEEEPSRGDGDVVTIHVCDENQQISKDFCCKRDILVKHMKYFEKFLAENENGYDDIDISVHCDVEIFEWLMTYIHEPDTPPKIEKAIIVSILISSEFLQMESLVELCIQHVAGSLNDIIRLPIDLSCISEKLVNRIAFITQPKTLSETKDRKDKILTKLYKRRVELDFSRKGSTARIGGATSIHNSNNNSGGSASVVTTRTIAASLTCCRHCGLVYLDNYVSLLTCRSSPPSIDFRGQLASRHAAIVGWSLTSYLKALHSGGMGWDAIYWHVWAACVVFRVENVMISALEVDRYTVEPDGLLIRASILREENDNMTSLGTNSGDQSPAGESVVTPGGSALPPRGPVLFSLNIEDDCRVSPTEMRCLKLPVARNIDHIPVNPTITSSLNPARPAEILTPEIFDLLCTQMKYIVGLAHKTLIQKTMKGIVDAARLALPPRAVDFGELLWRNSPRVGTYEGSVTSRELAASAASAENERRRGRSPGRGARATSLESRKHSLSLPKNGRASVFGANAAGIAAAKQSALALSDLGSASNDNSDQETTGRPPVGGERRSRSTSTGPRLTSALAPGLSGSTKNLKRLSLVSDEASAEEDGVSAPSASINGVPIDSITAKQIAALQSLPQEVHVRIIQTKGPVHSLWMVAHPLQIRSAAHAEVVRTVAESSIIGAKKLEWELDVMREFDEKRMEQFEKFLVSRRNRANEPAADYKRQPRGRGNKAPIDYYKDKGRQAWNR